MSERLLHTPEGVRDIYNAECEKKSMLEERLRHHLHLYGFRDIETPAFEFFDIFSEERGTVSSKEMYKFFDREGNTLVLRPDIGYDTIDCALYGKVLPRGNHAGALLLHRGYLC